MNNTKLQICSWLKEQTELRNKKALLINIKSDCVWSVLNYYFCKATQIPIHAVINSNDFKAKQYCIDNDIPHSIFNSFINVDQLMVNVNFPNMNKISYTEDLVKINSLEKTIFISYIADTTNSLYVGNLTRNDYYFVRKFPKMNCYDLLPFVNFSKTNLLNMIDYFEINLSEIDPNFIFIHDDLEWIYDLNAKSKIISSYEDPTNYEKWYAFTASQKALIAKIHQQDKLTAYKKVNAVLFTLNEK